MTSHILDPNVYGPAVSLQSLDRVLTPFCVFSCKTVHVTRLVGIFDEYNQNIK